MISNPKKNKEWGIYQITFPNGKSYIGQSSDLKRRMHEYKNWEKCCTAQTALYNAFKKYGYDSVNITYLYKNGGKIDYDILNQKEIDYITQYNTQVPNGYNIEKGGNNYEGKGGHLAAFIKKYWPYPNEPITNQTETIEYKDCIEWAKHEKIDSDGCYNLEDPEYNWKYKNEKQLKCTYGQFFGETPTIYENKIEHFEYKKKYKL